MTNKKHIRDKALFFENQVIEYFVFLENDFQMRRGHVRMLNQKDPREITAKIRYESDSHRLDIGWGIGENGIGILIWSKSCLDALSTSKNICYVYFEPFIEFLTNGTDKAIVPQVYPKMSAHKILKVMDEREKLFEKPLSEILSQLANKLKANYELIISKDIITFKAFHDWLAEQK